MSNVTHQAAEQMSAQEIMHIINNQLTIVMGRAALLGSTAQDPGTRSRCKEIESAVQTISYLLKRMPKE